MSKRLALERPLVAALLLGTAPLASGYIDLVLSRDGVQGYALDTAARDYLPYFPYLDPSYPRPEVIPFGTQLSGAGSIDAPFFLWGRFVNEPDESHMIGIIPAVWAADGDNLALGPSAIYRHAKRNGPPAERWVRWDGSQPIGINGLAVAVTENGIVNASNPFDLVCPDPNEGESILFLLGAFRLDTAVPGSDPLGALYLGLGTSGMEMWVPSSGVHYLPEVRVGGGIVQEYAEIYPGVPGSPTIHPPPGPYLTFVPEPSGLASLVLLTCLLPRRRWKLHHA
jgi:hypothetical protein